MLSVKLNDRVRRSVCPNSRIIAKRARGSSGPVSLYDYITVSEYIYFWVERKVKF